MPSGLEPGQESIGKGDSGAKCKRCMKVVVWGIGTGLVGLHLNHTLAGKSFSVCRNS